MDTIDKNNEMYGLGVIGLNLRAADEQTIVEFVDFLKRNNIDKVLTNDEVKSDILGVIHRAVNGLYVNSYLDTRDLPPGINSDGNIDESINKAGVGCEGYVLLINSKGVIIGVANHDEVNNPNGSTCKTNSTMRLGSNIKKNILQITDFDMYDNVISYHKDTNNKKDYSKQDLDKIVESFL